jgi:hypothetical protein
MVVTKVAVVIGFLSAGEGSSLSTADGWRAPAEIS